MSQNIESFEFIKDELIEAPIEAVFQAVLDEAGPESTMPDGTPMPFKLEAWPGGRWFRDLGNNTGHFWGTVQVIKPPKILEIAGPCFMSYPGLNHIQYKLVEEGKGTRLKFAHKSIGLIPKEQMEQMDMGWTHWFGRIRNRALRATKR
jgi:uncharacterized protein YndB with AHSA1/START domain